MIVARRRHLPSACGRHASEDYMGQGHVLGEDHRLRSAVLAGQAGSLLLYGPPGVGKTTLALLIAQHSGQHFEPFSAVMSSIKDVRAAVVEADQRRRREGKGTLLFVDEIHRFNKAQQDAFLPYVERGQVTLIGATTENPSFAVIPALLSRCRVVALRPLDPEDVLALLRRAMESSEGLGMRRMEIDDDALALLATHAGGDARRALTALEAAAASALDGDRLTREIIAEALQHRTLRHARGGDEHFEVLSAFHKSLRNSDAQAAVYWLARLLETEGDPMQAARRLLAVASEDVGLADPMALPTAVAALQAVQNLGLPEGRLALTQAALYLAAAPKSDSVHQAIQAASREVREGSDQAVPLHLRNRSSKTAADLGHGDGYVYAHDTKAGVAPFECLPEGLVGKTFYVPGSRGFEQKVAERLAEADRLRRGGR